MGRIAKLLSFVRGESHGAQVSDVKADPGGGANVTAQHFASPGDDAHPLPGDYVALEGAVGTGRANAVGYLDPRNEQKAGPGDKRVYARDADTGATVAELWLKSDGTATLINAGGSVTLAPGGAITGANDGGQFELQAGGDFVANGATMTTDGDVVTSDGISLRTHVHVGNFGANTSPPVP